MDLGKCMNAALLPSIVATIFAISASLLLFVINVIPNVECIFGPVFAILNGVILIWAGYRAAKNENELAASAISGLLAGLSSSTIAGTLNFVLVFIGLASPAIIPVYVNNIAFTLSNVLIVAQIIALVMGVATWTVIGVLAGLIGAFAANKRK